MPESKEKGKEWVTSDIFSVSKLLNHQTDLKPESEKDRNNTWNSITQLSFEKAYSQILLLIRKTLDMSEYWEKLNAIENFIQMIINNACAIRRARQKNVVSSKILLMNVVMKQSLKRAAFTKQEKYVTVYRAHILRELCQKVWAIWMKYQWQDPYCYSDWWVNSNDFEYISVKLHFISSKSKN